MAAFFIAACGGGSGDGLDVSGRPLGEGGGNAGTPAGADFSSIQANVFTPICTVCHAGAAAPLGLRLDQSNSYAMLVGVPSVQVPALFRVLPGDPENSYLIHKLEGTAAVGGQMPLGGPAIDRATIDLIRQWIADGAQLTDSRPPSTPPTVTSVAPDSGSVLSTGPGQIVASFSQPMDASLVSDTTFQLVASGGDGTFADGNETTIAPSALSVTNPVAITMDLAGVSLADDTYQIRLVGTGVTALADVDGLLLDGDADGVAGGDFLSTFILDSSVAGPEPTWRWIQDNVFTPVCTQCHIANGSAAFLMLDEPNSFAMLVNVTSTEVPSLLRVVPGDPDNSYLVQKLEGTATIGGRMPLGLDPLAPDVITAIRQWIGNGALLEPGDPMPDQTAPVVALDPPLSPVAGVVALTATASDDVAVAEVRFLVDGIPIATVSALPYTTNWDTTTVTNGTHTLSVEADDSAGNTGVSNVVTLEVDNAPAVDVTPPAVAIADPGSPATGVITITVTASDNVAVSAVQLFVDNTLLGTANNEPYRFTWDTNLVGDGNHVLTADASDAVGNIGTAVPVTVTVDNTAPPDTEAPQITIEPLTSPVSGNINVTLSASDNIGVTEVRLFADGALVGTSNVAPYVIAWDTTNLLDGIHVLSANALDAAGNVGGASPVSVEVVNGGPQPTLAWIQANVFTPTCIVCHSAGGSADFLLLTDGDSFGQLVNVPTTEGGPPFRVVPNDPNNSALVQRLEGTLTPSMPLGGQQLPQATIDVIRQWITDGALEAPVDTAPPAVALVPPGSPLAGTVSLTVNASDNTALAEVRILLDGVVIATGSQSPLTTSWDTTTVADGTHTLSAEAVDAAGNRASSTPIAVTVDNTLPPDSTPPVVAIIDPGSPLAGVVPIEIQASDDVGVVLVTLLVDGVVVGQDTGAPYQISWDTVNVSNGIHQLSAEARDAAGNLGTSGTVSIEVANTGPPLDLSIIAPSQAVAGDEFDVSLNVTNNTAASEVLSATLSFEPTNILRIRDPGPTQSLGNIAAGSQARASWIMRGEEVGLATITISVSNSTGTIDMSTQATISIIN